MHAIKILNNLKMKNMGDCHNLYLKTDLLLFTNVFEKFINRSLKLISDIDKYYFAEKGLRGGIAYISKRFSEANNIHEKL